MPIVRKKRKPKRRVGLMIFNIFIVTLLLSIMIGAGVIYYIVQDSIAKLPEIDPENVTLDQNSQILDAKGDLLSKVYSDGLRTVIPFEQMGKAAVNAFIAVEDKTFWEHNGFNYTRMLGAIKEALLSQGDVSGTSTITQQLARNLFLTETRLDYSPVRKIQEAYYAMIIEEKLPKEKILETYLNTIFLGSSANGLQAAANIYFNKDAKDLDYIEGAMLAALPSAPTNYSPMIPTERKYVESGDVVLGERDSQYVYVYNPNIEERYKYVLSLMKDQKFITEEEYNTGIATDLKTKLNPGKFYNENISNFFVETVQEQVVKDLMKAKEITRDQAYNLLLTGGYTIHSTLEEEEQQFLQRKFMEEGSFEYFNGSLESAITQFQNHHDIYADGVVGDDTWKVLIEKGYFTNAVLGKSLSVGSEDPLVAELKRAVTKEGFAAIHPYISSINPVFSGGRIELPSGDLLYDYKNLFDSEKNFLLPSDYFTVTEGGDAHIEKSGLVKFEQAGEDYIFVGLGDMYHYGTNTQDRENKNEGTYTLPYILLYESGSLPIPTKYLAISGDTLIIRRSAFDDGIVSVNEHGELVVQRKYVYMSDMPVVQPQSAAAIIDHHTGYLKAIFGGRGVTGRNLFNRATSPTQTGSAIKPLAVYGPGIDSQKFTAATVVIDEKRYDFNPGSNEPWPVNFEDHFRGPMSARAALRVSQNVPAVLFGEMNGYNMMADYLEKNGVTTLVREGDSNDLNAAALSLGSLTYGISPVEMASAYGTFGNEGFHVNWKSYTKVVDNQGNVVLDNEEAKGERVFSEQANYIMTDLLKDVVQNYAYEALIGGGHPVIGKTGTTGYRKQNTDTWFCGVTPYVSCSLWVGTDRNISLTEGSYYAATFWGRIMSDYHSDLEPKFFAEQPEGVVWRTVVERSGKLPAAGFSFGLRSELFITGTTPTQVDDSFVTMTVCKKSGLTPTKYCQETEERIFQKIYNSNTGKDELRDENGELFDPEKKCEECEKKAKEKEEKENKPVKPGEPTNPQNPENPENPENPDDPPEANPTNP